MTVTIPDVHLQLLQVDPARLTTNPANIRRKLTDIDELAASIAKVGVLVPLVVRPDGVPDAYVIVAGHRRAAAALKAGVTHVPVIVHQASDDASADVTAMLVENLHREDLTPADEAHGFEQLAAFGVTVDEIAQLTGRTKDRVETGLKIARSTVGAAVAAKYDLTLEQAAAIAEFDTDTAIVKELTFAAQKRPQDFDHHVQRARQERDRLTARAGQQAKLQAAGASVLADGKRFGYDLASKNGVYLTELTDAAGKNLTAANHKKCPGHAGEIDHWGRTVVYGCADPKKHGHRSKRAASSTSSSSGNGAKKAPGKTAAVKEKEAAAKRRAEEDAAAVEASTVVRRKFVRELLARKTPPKGTLGFVVPVVLEFEIWGGGSRIVEELTGAKPKASGSTTSESALLGLVTGASEARLQVVLLAWVACTFEEDWGVFLLAPAKFQSNQGEARYLQFLGSCGYGLSEVEQRIVAVAFPPVKSRTAGNGKTSSS